MGAASCRTYPRVQMLAFRQSSIWPIITSTVELWGFDSLYSGSLESEMGESHCPSCQMMSMTFKLGPVGWHRDVLKQFPNNEFILNKPSLQGFEKIYLKEMLKFTALIWRQSKWAVCHIIGNGPSAKYFNGWPGDIFGCNIPHYDLPYQATAAIDIEIPYWIKQTGYVPNYPILCPETVYDHVQQYDLPGIAGSPSCTAFNQLQAPHSEPILADPI